MVIQASSKTCLFLHKGCKRPAICLLFFQPYITGPKWLNGPTGSTELYIHIYIDIYIID